jgi:hypothetical protein
LGEPYPKRVGNWDDKRTDYGTVLVKIAELARDAECNRVVRLSTLPKHADKK